MRCLMARTLLNEYLQGTLNPTTRDELEAHLSKCPECTRLLEEQRTVGDGASSMGGEAPRTLAQEATPISEANGHSASKRRDPFVPQTSHTPLVDAHTARQRLESHGVLFPEPGSLQPPDTPQKLTVDLADDDPLQHLWKRFGPVDTVFPFTQTPAPTSASSKVDKPDTFAPVPRSQASGTEGGTESEHAMSASSISIPEFRLPSIRPALIESEAARSDDALWVDIVVTHHVTRKQLRKRVRRDSAEAQRYFAEITEDSVDRKQTFTEGEEVPLSDPLKTMKVKDAMAEDAVEMPEYILPIAREMEPDHFTLTPESPHSRARAAVDNLTNQNPDQVQVVYAVTEEVPGAFPEQLVRHVSDSDEEPETMDVALNQANYIDLSGVEDDTENAEIAVSSVIQENSDEIGELTLFDAYQTAEALPERRPSPQSNPIVSRPAEIGRERLERQSRFARDEQSVIVRDMATTPSLPSHSFSRMRWTEKLRRNPTYLIILILLLSALLIFLVGMVTSMLNSPGALAKQEMLQRVNGKIAADAVKLEEWADGILSDLDSKATEAFPDSFDLTSVSDETRLYAQLSDLNSLYEALGRFPVDLYTVECRDAERMADAQAVGEQLRFLIGQVCQPLKAEVGAYPLSDANWRRMQDLLEPVATLALRYERTGALENVPLSEAKQTEADLHQRCAAIFAGETDLSATRMERIVSRRDGSDCWWIECTAPSWPQEEGYLLRLSDADASFYSLRQLDPQSDFGYIVPMQQEAVERFMEQVFGDGTQFVTLGGIENEVGQTIFWLAPVRKSIIYPEEPIVLHLHHNGTVLEAYRDELQVKQLGDPRETKDPATDLFTAASRARQHLTAEVGSIVQETVLLAVFSRGLLGEPRQAWLYRAKIGDDWRSVIVEEDQIVSLHKYCLMESLSPITS